MGIAICRAQRPPDFGGVGSPSARDLRVPLRFAEPNVSDEWAKSRYSANKTRGARGSGSGDGFQGPASPTPRGALPEAHAPGPQGGRAAHLRLTLRRVVDKGHWVTTHHHSARDSNRSSGR